jgi:hypothetical protein
MTFLESALWRFYWELGPIGLTSLGVLAFVGLASSRTAIGDDMDRPHRIGQLYGYSVCLIAVVTFLTSANTAVKSVFVLSDPIASTAEPFRSGFEPSLTSFEAFRATYMFGGGGMASITPLDRGGAADSVPRFDTLSTADLRTRYEALRGERITQGRYAATRELVTSALLMGIAVVLFIAHWRWLRARERQGTAPA